MLLVGVCANMDETFFAIAQSWSELAPKWMTLLLNSFRMIMLLVGACANMDHTSFALVLFCLAAGRDLRLHR